MTKTKILQDATEPRNFRSLVEAAHELAQKLTDAQTDVNLARDDRYRLDRLEELPGRVDITYNAKLSKSATPTFRSQIDYFLALVDAGRK